jgi:transposase
MKGLTRPTILKWTRKDKYENRRGKKTSSILDPYKVTIRTEYALSNTNAAQLFRNIQLLGYKGSKTTVREFISKFRQSHISNVSLLLPCQWMQIILRGKASIKDIGIELKDFLNIEEVTMLLNVAANGSLRNRNRSVVVLAYFKNIDIPTIARFLMVSRPTVVNCISRFCKYNSKEFFSSKIRGEIKKYDNPKYKDALFDILHSPPNDYGINRTSWTMPNLHNVMRQKNLPISVDSIRKIIRNAGYRFRKAKKVLTSTDPNYRRKLEEITAILSSLSESESFFSIDEFGPFAVNIRGGKALTAPMEQRTFPQWQKSKGSLLLVGALDLPTNQITHFYAQHKRTAEMIELLHILLHQYRHKERLYLSWDAASWHVSKRFKQEVENVNTNEYRNENATPSIVLAPLPSCAQFLNVIESVFSGMARAILHNSNYESVDKCKAAIDLYFLERNQQFKENPKRAGNKIWGKEREFPIFKGSNNCKDPYY